jgi:hypothetical protein
MRKAWALVVVLALGIAPAAQERAKVLDRDTFMDMETVSATSIAGRPPGGLRP